MQFDLSHFGLLVFGILLAWPRKDGRDSTDRLAWVLVAFIFIALAWQWQHANGWPGFSGVAIIATSLYVSMFVFGLALGRLVGGKIQSVKRVRSRL